ncbi:MAG: hypothetical protein AB7S74_18725 [Hyphomicrobium sp.]
MALIDSIIGAESGGNPNAKNPNSSATGLGQFIASTWLDTLSRERPDLVAGKSRDEILALRNDPDLSRQMTEAYAAQNGKIISNAGFEANPGNTYLAHFAGPQGAVKVLSADPNAPVEAVLGPQAVAANPFLKGMTAAGLQAWAAKKMGAAPQLAMATNTPASPAAPPAATPQPAPIFAPSQPQAVPQQAEAPSYFAQMPAEQAIQAPPIFTAPRKAVDLSKLRAALQASGARPIFGKS